MNKIYIFLLIIAYYIMVTLINPFEISNSFFQKKEIEKKKKFIDTMIDRYAFFLSSNQISTLKKIIQKNNDFFLSIDQIYLGEIMKEQQLISSYYLIGKSYMSTYLKDTPNCLRIVNHSFQKHKYGYIYFDKINQISTENNLKIILSGILFHQINSNKKLHLPKEDIYILNNFLPYYNKKKIINFIYDILDQKKNKLKIASKIVENNYNILYHSLNI